MFTAQSPTFGVLLKRHRRSAGMTQEELAERAGLSVRGISDLERGLRQPRKDTLQLLLVTLQLAADEQARLEEAARIHPSEFEGAGARGPLLQTEGSFLGTLPSGPLVSRQHEIHRILTAVEVVAGGSGRLVMLTGEPGIGKTRLAQEVALEAGRQGFLVASGRCYEPEQDVPFYPILEMLATAYAAALPAVQDEVPLRWPYLGWLLPEDVLEVSAPARRGWVNVGEEQRLFWAVSGFLGAVAQDMPVALLLDDLHWADSASLKLLLHLARFARSNRILLLGTYRDVELGPPGTVKVPLARALVDLNRERLVERVSVHRLTRQGTAELIAATMGDIEVSPEFAGLIHHSTDGNPFFVQEVLRALVERGEIYQKDGHWTCRDIREFQTPETVRAAIGERLARLPAEAQAVLYRASVLGHTFDFDDLRALEDSSEEEIDRALESAVSAGLIREVGASEYAFNHALTQQTLYEDLSMRRRRRLHLAAGEALDGLPEGVRQRRAAELARHFREGGDRERAVRYTMLAGDQAVEVFAYGQAERHFRIAVELVTAGDSSLASEALAKLGRVLDLTERYDEALPPLEQAAELYRMQGNVAGEGSAVTEIGWIHHNRGTDEEGLARVQPVVARLEQESASSRQHQVVAALHTALSRLFFGLGRYADELQAAERAAQLAREVGDQTLLAVAQARRGAALMTLGQRDEAREALEEAIALAQATGNLGTMTVALDYLGEIARDGGDYRQGQRDCERAVELAEQIGVPGRIAWTLTKLGRIHMLKGEWAETRAIMQRALRLLGDDPRSAAYPRIHLGQTDLLEGNWEKGSAQVEAAMQAEAPGRDLWLRQYGERLLAERDLLTGQPEAALARLTPLTKPTAGQAQQGTIMHTLLFAPLAWAYVELDREDEAEAVLAEGMAQARARNHRMAQADLLRIQGMLRSRQGRWQEAGEVLEVAIQLAQDMPDPYREMRTRAEAGLLASRTGDRAQAREHLQEALAIAQRLGARPYIRSIRHSLAGSH